MATEHSITCTWKSGIAYEAKVSGFQIPIDGAKEVGGQDSGARPKQLMLASLAGCSGIDVASILKKMRVNFDSLDIHVTAKLSDDSPQVYTYVHLLYTFRGENIDRLKCQRAVDLSQNQYCGVTLMFKKFAEVSYDLEFFD
ncbi:MAG: OsmC family protein [Cyclobacteriaceae bacterium]|nr:OsmC family protein [Cyclobacteriaceae bacterium]